MKKFLLIPILLLLFLSGCVTYVEVDGVRYAALSESQKARLVAV